jgi:hypothetical protein
MSLFGSSGAPVLRIVSKDGTPHNTQVMLDDVMVPGVKRVSIDIDAEAGFTDIRLHFGYVDIDLSLPGCGSTWSKR